MESTHPMTRRKLSLPTAAWAGLIAGLVFMMLEMIMVPVFGGGSPWGPPRMIAAIAMGPDVLPPPATFDLTILLVAMLVHFVLAIVLAVILAVLVKDRAQGMALAIGAVFGLVVYLVNFYGMTAVFPWFAMARNWISIFAHVVFGVVAAWSYLALASRRAG